MTSDPFSLVTRKALVLGASSDIGSAAAIALAEAGADVALGTTLKRQVEQQAISRCADRIRQTKRMTLTQCLDSSDKSELEQLVTKTGTSLGGLDILVCAHDLPFAKPVEEITDIEWQKVIQVNLTGVFLACQAVSRPMLSARYGRIINIVSLLAERGMANGSAYCAAQAGVLNLTRALSLEWARSGITVNAIGAGWTEAAGFFHDPSMKERLTQYLPTKRLGKPHEIGHAAVYLASHSTGFMTGQTLWLEGGALSRL